MNEIAIRVLAEGVNSVEQSGDIRQLFLACEAMLAEPEKCEKIAIFNNYSKINKISEIIYLNS
jgi:hypothetical protein